ncbi:MAG: hypothetical protein KC434_12830 [Anaerolineales bacterium]|nr:hypothetical protein [Anaerolineales bacterium]
MSSPAETEPAAAPSRWRRAWPWINGILTAVLLIGGIWYLARTIEFTDIRDALRAANGRFILQPNLDSRVMCGEQRPFTNQTIILSRIFIKLVSLPWLSQ